MLLLMAALGGLDPGGLDKEDLAVTQAQIQVSELAHHQIYMI